jgi:hypothetical protein
VSRKIDAGLTGYNKVDSVWYNGDSLKYRISGVDFTKALPAALLRTSGGTVTGTIVANTSSSLITKANIPNSTEFILAEAKTSDVDKGKMALRFGNYLWNSQINPIIHWGYNMTIGGLPESTTDSSGAAWHIEGHYNDGTKNTIETYFQYAGRKNGVVKTTRPIFFQVDKATDKIVLSELKGDVIKFISDDTNAQAEGGSNTYTFLKNQMTIHAPDATQNTTLNVLAATGQPAVLNLAHGATNNALQIYPDNATISALYIQGQRILTMYKQHVGTNASRISIGPSIDNSAVVLAENSGNANGKGLVARGMAAQVGNLFEAQNSSSVALASIDPSGNLMATSLKSGAPSGGTAATWKLGSKVDATVSLVTDKYIQVEIGGVAYKLALVQ